MSLQFDTDGYNLTLIPHVGDEESPAQLDADDFRHFMRDPVFMDEEKRVISIRDQLSLAFQPPTVVITDHADEDPFRPDFLRLCSAVTEILTHLGLSIVAYGWNVSGSIPDLDPVQAMRRLANGEKLDDAIARAGGRQWVVPQHRIVIDSVIADRITIAIRAESDNDSKRDLSFSLNAHFDRAPFVADLPEEGAGIWRASQKLLSRLVGP